MKWYVLNIFNNWENKVKESIEKEVEKRNLQNKLGRIVYPKESYVQERKTKKVKSEKSSFPGYLFVECELNREILGLIRTTNGVVEFLGADKNNSNPLPMKDREVKDLLEKVDGILDEKTQILSHNFKIDQKVKITDGPFQTMIATIRNFDKNKISLEINIFNRITALELTLDQISADLV